MKKIVIPDNLLSKDEEDFLKLQINGRIEDKRTLWQRLKEKMVNY